MLIIRQDQIDYLNHLQLEKFTEQELLPFVIRNFPIDYALLGEAACLKALIQIAGRGVAFGYTKKSQLCSWITLSLMLGTYLDKDPMLPWYGIFQAKSFEDTALQLSRIDRMSDHYIKSTAGENGEHFLRGLLKIYRMKLADFQTVNGDVQEKSRELFEIINARKYSRVRNTYWSVFFIFADETFQVYGIADPTAQILICCIMFLLGSKVVNDPVHPWVGNMLKNMKNHKPEQQRNIIYQQAWTAMGTALSHLELA